MIIDRVERAFPSNAMKTNQLKVMVSVTLFSWLFDFYQPSIDGEIVDFLLFCVMKMPWKLSLSLSLSDLIAINVIGCFFYFLFIFLLFLLMLSEQFRIDWQRLKLKSWLLMERKMCTIIILMLKWFHPTLRNSNTIQWKPTDCRHEDLFSKFINVFQNQIKIIVFVVQSVSFGLLGNVWQQSLDLNVSFAFPNCL